MKSGMPRYLGECVSMAQIRFRDTDISLLRMGQPIGWKQHVQGGAGCKPCGPWYFGGNCLVVHRGAEALDKLVAAEEELASHACPR